MKEFIIKLIPAGAKRTIRRKIGKIRSAGKPKIFGIGMNKTGTTSLKAAMQELGYVTGRQSSAEKLIEDWAQRDFKRGIRGRAR